MIDEMPNVDPIRPTNKGRLCSGMTCVMMTVAPFCIPADPTPAMARPTINALEFGAAPQIAEPTSKTMAAARNRIFVE